MWLIGDAVELRRTAIALNGTKAEGSLGEALDFLAVHPEELVNVGAIVQETPADVDCEAVQGLHRDVTFPKDSALKLCTTLINGNRELQRCTRGNMKEAKRLAEKEGCFVFQHSTHCECGATRDR